MIRTVTVDVLDLVERIFLRTVPAVDAIEAMVALDDQFVQLAQAKKFWVINKALGKIAEFLKKDMPPELLQALAQRIPLEPESIFEQMGKHPGYPEVDVALVDNLLRYERLVDEVSELDYRLRQMVEDGGMEAHVITVLDEIVRRGNGWAFWCELVSEVLIAALDRRDVYPKCSDPLQVWFVQNETRIVEIEDSYDLCLRWSFKDSLRLYAWGTKELGKIAMNNAGHRAANFEFLKHVELMDEESIDRNYYCLDSKPKLCFILATPQPIAPWMMDNLDFRRLADCFEEAKKEQRVFDQEKVTFLVLEASRTLDSYDAYQLIRKLNEQSYPQSTDTLTVFFSNVAKRHLQDPLVLCRIYEVAGENKVDLDVVDYREWPIQTLMEAASQLTQDKVVNLLTHFSMGMQLPRRVVEVAVDQGYASWPEDRKNEVRRIAPEWLLSYSEQLREDKLFTDMGL
jgi:hypothetical protein